MRRKRNGGIIVLLAMMCIMIGFIAGMIVIHEVDSKNEKIKVDALKEELREAKIEQEKPINVYFPRRDIVYGEVPRNSYIPQNFVIEDGFMAYYDENGEKISHMGIDLSYHNDKVNWEKLADSPIEFVMLRCGFRGYTEGGLVEDEKFKEYAAKANEYGLDLGVYFFTQAITEKEAIAEADYVIKLIEDYDISYPVAFDTEYVDGEDVRTNIAELTPEELSDICIAFCERIKEAGYYPMIYASENWFRRRLDTRKIAEYDFWAPQYLDENDFLYDFTIWQYTETGNAPGVEGDCDLNISLVDYASFVPALREAVKTGGTIGEYSDDTPSIMIQ